MWRLKQIYVNTIVKNKSDLDQVDFMEKLTELDETIQGVELRNEFDDVRELSEEEVRRYKELNAGQEWTYFLSVPAELFTAQGVRADFEEIVQAAHRLSIKNLKFNLGDAAGITEVDAKAFNQVLADNRLSVTIENGQDEKSGPIASIENALKLIDEAGLEIGFTFDIGNWVVVGENPEEALNTFKDSITIVHVKNTNAAGDWMLVDQGEAAWENFLGLDVPYILEYPMTEDEFHSQYDLFSNELNK